MSVETQPKRFGALVNYVKNKINARTENFNRASLGIARLGGGGEQSYYDIAVALGNKSSIDFGPPKYGQNACGIVLPESNNLNGYLLCPYTKLLSYADSTIDWQNQDSLALLDRLTTLWPGGASEADAYANSLTNDCIDLVHGRPTNQANDAEFSYAAVYGGELRSRSTTAYSIRFHVRQWMDRSLNPTLPKQTLIVQIVNDGSETAFNDDVNIMDMDWFKSGNLPNCMALTFYNTGPAVGALDSACRVVDEASGADGVFRSVGQGVTRTVYTLRKRDLSVSVLAGGANGPTILNVCIDGGPPNGNND
jgi:hypothetical protein